MTNLSIETHNPFSSITITITWFFLFLTLIHKSHSARSLSDPYHHHRDSDNRAMSFYMLDVLSEKNQYSSQPVPSRVEGHLPFSKPLGNFPPFGAIPLSMPDPIPTTGLASQTFDLEGIGMTFPAIATLHELELGIVTTIDEDIYEGSGIFGSVFLGKAQGIYVASSEDGIISHMVAMTASFAHDEYNDGLRFFGVQRTDVSESHIAIIGGTGKYQNANGYATVKAVRLSSVSLGVRKKSDEAYCVLQFDVYLG